MDLTREIRDGVTIVTVAEPRIDAAVAIRFKDGMREATQDAPGRVVLDLGRVDFIDSSGLGAIVAAMKQLPGGRRLELAALSPTVDRVLRLTRMDSVFTIHSSTASALGRPEAC